METTHRTRRLLRGFALAALLVVPQVLPAGADEVVGAVAASGRVVIHDAQETLRDFCSRDSLGALWLTLPGVGSFELVTATDDPAVANPGDGAFHPFDAAEVSAALAAVDFPLAGVSAEVYLLPYPRRVCLTSVAGPGLILLSPGVWTLPREQQHAEFVHELGHVVQHAHLPDSDTETWDRYRLLRGITDLAVYSSAAPHSDRPHEIFAEDFRALFGGPLARSTGSIENAMLEPPAEVEGLEDFMLSLAGPALTVTLGVHPNPARGPVVFSRQGATTAALEVYDVTGRRLATVAPQAVHGGARWTWDGRDGSGSRLAAGVVFARLRDGSASARVTLLP